MWAVASFAYNIALIMAAVNDIYTDGRYTDIEKNSGDIKWIFDQSKQLTDFSAINIPLDESGGAYILVVNTTLGAIGVYIVSKYYQTHQYSTVTLQGQSNISIDSNKSSLTVNVDGTVYFTAYLSRIGK